VTPASLASRRYTLRCPIHGIETEIVGAANVGRRLLEHRNGLEDPFDGPCQFAYAEPARLTTTRTVRRMPR
jgi:hypothetical protein